MIAVSLFKVSLEPGVVLSTKSFWDAGKTRSIVLARDFSVLSSDEHSICICCEYTHVFACLTKNILLSCILPQFL